MPRMAERQLLRIVWLLLLFQLPWQLHAISKAEQKSLSLEVKEMFYHGYNNYLELAYPADELMPLSCRGRVRGKDKSRGDIDDALGRFSLTLIDTLDALVVFGNVTEFKRAVDAVLRDVSFDRNIVVSTFETNIRVLGGLLSAHAIIVDLKSRPKYHQLFHSYKDEVLTLATDLGDRLLKAFDTATGIPYSRINLRHGADQLVRRNDVTCTACAGTIIMEFAALSRYTGNPTYEQAARRALEALWIRRGANSDLVGTTINITSGHWHRTDAGVGAGIDSYYEYLLKAFIMLGDETYLEVFNTHYSGIMKHLKRGPFIVDTHVHNPHVLAKKYMDALQTFFPGLQVLKGDLPPAIETHRMYYDILQRHKFFPEAFFPDFKVNWASSPLRPEFAESTYYLYKATGDPVYLEMGKELIERLQKYARVKCGWAAIKDIRRLTHEDKMDSFVLAETFKYLYLLFTDDEDIPIDLDDYVFSTEAHLLPTNLAHCSLDYIPFKSHDYDNQHHHDHSCLNTFDAKANFLRIVGVDYGLHPLQCSVYSVNFKRPKAAQGPPPTVRRKYKVAPQPITPKELDVQNEHHLAYLEELGMHIDQVGAEIRIVHVGNVDADKSKQGLQFLQELMEHMATQQKAEQALASVQLIESGVTDWGEYQLAGPASFGPKLTTDVGTITSTLALAEPLTACSSLPEVNGKILVVGRGGCMFVEKVRFAEAAGAIGVIVVDNLIQRKQPPDVFTMSGDGGPDPTIPAVFFHRGYGQRVISALEEQRDIKAIIRAATEEEVDLVYAQ